MATIYWEQGRYAEAEAHLKRSLTIAEKVLGPEHRHVATALNNLAEMYGVQGRPAEAEPLYKRSLAIREKVLGPGHVDVAIPLNNLGSMYWGQGRYAEAEPFMKRALAIREKVLGANHPDVGQSLSNLAALFNSQRRLAEAEPLLKRSLAIREKALGGEHPSVANSLNNLANLYREMKRYAEAEPLYKRSLAIAKKGLGSDHPHVITVLSGLASLALAQGNLTAAADYLRQAAAIVQRRASRGTSSKAEAAGNGEAQRLSGVFASLVKVTHRFAAAGSAEQQRHATETFEMAQWGQASEAAASLAQMAARSAGGSRELAGLVRERQDLLAEWQTKDKLLAAARGMLPAQRVAATETALIDRLSAIDTRLVEIDARFTKDFPDHAALVSPKPASVKEVQAALAADEALALFLDTNDLLPPFPDETFTWVVTKHDMRLMRSELGMAGLRREVAALRCGLDAALWDDEPAATRCRGLVKGTPQRDASGLIRADTLPFDFARAHALYKNLFGQAEDLIRDKRLLIVPSGALTQLPFQVLLTAEAKDGESAWLARSHTVTVLPAAASLKALRRVVKPSVATRPMIGFGNPLLDGDPASRPWEADWAKKARERQACTDIFAAQQSASAPHRARAAVRGVAVAGRADLEHLRSQPPLFDTAGELCAVAKALKVASQDILLGSRATEAGIKRLNAEGRLAQYRVLHFATHGTIAGEIEGTTEPGLILTPPKEQSDMDDGFLSASEVAALKLDADWVILSACNTAAGGANGAEALSGLARAFIYAGARALLVSHWAVDSAATVELITAAVGATAHNPRLGRAAAMRSAMLGMIDSGEARKAHPAYWAPFVVVGEGAVPK